MSSKSSGQSGQSGQWSEMTLAVGVAELDDGAEVTVEGCPDDGVAIGAVGAVSSGRGCSATRDSLGCDVEPWASGDPLAVLESDERSASMHQTRVRVMSTDIGAFTVCRP